MNAYLRTSVFDLSGRENLQRRQQHHHRKASHSSMVSLTIIPYTPKPANSYRSNNHYRTKDASKRISDDDKEPRIKPGVLPVNIPQPQAIAAAGEAGSLATHEKDSNSINDGGHLSSKRRGSHGSACTSQAQACSHQTYSQQPQ